MSQASSISQTPKVDVKAVLLCKLEDCKHYLGSLRRRLDEVWLSAPVSFTEFVKLGKFQPKAAGITDALRAVGALSYLPPVASSATPSFSLTWLNGEPSGTERDAMVFKFCRALLKNTSDLDAKLNNISAFLCRTGDFPDDPTLNPFELVRAVFAVSQALFRKRYDPAVNSKTYQDIAVAIAIDRNNAARKLLRPIEELLGLPPAICLFDLDDNTIPPPPVDIPPPPLEPMPSSSLSHSSGNHSSAPSIPVSPPSGKKPIAKASPPTPSIPTLPPTGPGSPFLSSAASATCSPSC